MKILLNLYYLLINMYEFLICLYKILNLFEIFELLLKSKIDEKISNNYIYDRSGQFNSTIKLIL
jgi:hypothetical protein